LPWAYLKRELPIAVLARNEEKNPHVLDELKALGGPALALRADVTARGQLQPALEQVEQTLGPVSILVNNAGIAAFGGVLEQTPEDWDRVIETKLNACSLLSKLAAASMVKQRRGRIINIASMYALFGASFVPSYSAAKGALVQLTKSMAIELAPFNIQVKAIAPGFIETDLTEFVKTTPLYQEVIARTPAGRWRSSRPVRRRGCVSGAPCFGFCHRVNPRRRWWLRHPMSPCEAKPFASFRKLARTCPESIFASRDRWDKPQRVGRLGRHHSDERPHVLQVK
jgi:NAD(P)-dependent dehydrogenase (short-subunit alcohol dehydrogenase family)